MRTRSLAAASLLAVVALCAGPAAGASAEPAVALASGNTLRLFDTETPNDVTSLPISGLLAGEGLRGIDAQPSTGKLLAVASPAVSSNAVLRTYQINMATGAATLIGSADAALPAAGDLATGWDFNPTVDRLRYVNQNDENARINPFTGGIAGDDANLLPAAGTAVIAAAYDRNRPSGGATTLYVIDRDGSALGMVGGVGGDPSPNLGGITDLAPLGFNLHASTDGGFDVSPSGAAYAALTSAADNLTRLYSISLPRAPTATPVARSLGFIGNGGTEVRSLTILHDPDADGVGAADNCRDLANADQADLDGDGFGDPCDQDDDADLVPDLVEITLGTNPRSSDSDGDGRLDGADRCPTVAASTPNGCALPLPAELASPLAFQLEGLPRSIALRRLVRRGVRMTVAPNQPAGFLAELLGTARGGRVARAGDLVLAERRLALAGGRRTLRLRVPRTQRAKLRRRARLRVRVTATDAIGRTTALTRRLRIR